MLGKGVRSFTQREWEPVTILGAENARGKSVNVPQQRGFAGDWRCQERKEDCRQGD